VYLTFAELSCDGVVGGHIRRRSLPPLAILGRHRGGHFLIHPSFVGTIRTHPARQMREHSWSVEVTPPAKLSALIHYSTYPARLPLPFGIRR
jgi:hypothetical protein